MASFTIGHSTHTFTINESGSTGSVKVLTEDSIWELSDYLKDILEYDGVKPWFVRMTPDQVTLTDPNN